MNIQFAKMGLSPAEGVHLATKMTDVLIQYHESKIEKESTEEDILHRESKIISLQQNLHHIKKAMKEGRSSLGLEAHFNIIANEK